MTQFTFRERHWLDKRFKTPFVSDFKKMESGGIIPSPQFKPQNQKELRELYQKAFREKLLYYTIENAFGEVVVAGSADMICDVESENPDFPMIEFCLPLAFWHGYELSDSDSLLNSPKGQYRQGVMRDMRRKLSKSEGKRFIVMKDGKPVEFTLENLKALKKQVLDFADDYFGK